MKDLGNTICSFGYVVAATVLGIGVADYWFGNHQFTAFLSWAALATIPWLVGRASLYVLARLGDIDTIFHAAVGMKLVAVTRRAGLQRTSPSCPSYCGIELTTPFRISRASSIPNRATSLWLGQ